MFPSRLSKASLNFPTRSLVIFAFIYANSLGAHGSPIPSKDATEKYNLHQILQRDVFDSTSSDSDTRIRIIIPVVAALLAFLAFLFVVAGIKINNARHRENPGARSLQSAALARLGQGRNASENERTRRPQREYSTHSLPAYAKEPGESEQIILREMPASPAERRLDNEDEETSTNAESFRESQSPSQITLITTRAENHTHEDSSSPNPPTDSQRPSEGDADSRVRITNNVNPALANTQGEFPPSYVETVDQRSAS